HDPTGNLFENFRVLAHRRAHFSLGQSVRAGKVQFEGIHANVLTALDNFRPRVAIVFLHDRRDENAVGMLVFALFEFVEPDVELAIADKLDVLPADNVLAIRCVELRVTRRDVDHFRGVEADRFRDDRAPTFAERAGDDVEICPGRAGSDHERVWQFQSIDGGSECWHNVLLCKIAPFIVLSDEIRYKMAGYSLPDPGHRLVRESDERADGKFEMLFFSVFDLVVADAAQALNEHHDRWNSSARDFGCVVQRTGRQPMWIRARFRNRGVSHSDQLIVEPDRLESPNYLPGRTAT